MAFTDGVNVILTGMVTQLSSGAASAEIGPDATAVPKQVLKRSFETVRQKVYRNPNLDSNNPSLFIRLYLLSVFGEGLWRARQVVAGGDGLWDRSLKVTLINHGHSCQVHLSWRLLSGDRSSGF